MLLESLIAIAIFSFGLLGMIAMQAAAIKYAGDAKFRTDASYLVGQMISQMWVDRANLADYVYLETGTGCAFTGTTTASANVATWLGDATKKGSVLGALPNATAQIKVETGSNLVTLTVCWRAPQEATTHNFTTSTLISG